MQSIEWYNFQWPWVTSDPDFKITTILKSNIRKKLLLHKRKLYLTYGMVLCLVTLTDLWTRRAGLSASAEILVQVRDAVINLIQHSAHRFRSRLQMLCFSSQLAYALLMTRESYKIGAVLKRSHHYGFVNSLTTIQPLFDSLSRFWWPFSRWTWVSRCLLKQRMMEVVVTTGLLEL